jgi:hypothetical protein
MAERLEEVMSHAYTELEERQHLEAETSLLKTYLLEAHSDKSTHGDIRSLLRGAFGRQGLGERSEAHIHETEEELFYSVDVKWATNSAEFYVDASDQRFWLLHSVSKSTSADRILQRVIANDTHLDSAWLPMQLLEQVAQMGLFRGLGLDFDRREVPDVDFEAPDAPVEYLKMQLWGNRAREVLNTLRGADAFADATTLSKVRVKHWLDRAVDQDSFTLDDVKWDGKITARGTSFQSHINLVTNVYRAYAAKVTGFEARFSLRYVGAQVANAQRAPQTVSGEPFNITFSRPIANLEKFLDSIFSGAEPFRLWGAPVSIGRNYYRVTALDLHVTHRITFEITPDFMRVYIPDGSCGNTIARLYTNLQHYYDSGVAMKSGGGENLF